MRSRMRATRGIMCKGAQSMSEAIQTQQSLFDARAAQIMSQEPLLSVRDLEVTFSLRGKLLTAIRRTSLDLYEGETLAIVGESGSGKSVFTKLVFDAAFFTIFTSEHLTMAEIE